MSRRQPLPEAQPYVRAFFPHSRKDYGTQRATDAIRVIRAAWPGCEIVDPRTIDWKELGKISVRPGMVDETVVRDCNLVVGLEKDGYIGRGVYGGLDAGLRLGKGVYVVRGDKVEKVHKLVVNDPDDWAYKYGRVVIHRAETDSTENPR